jgi:uncharacterized membrane protein
LLKGVTIDIYLHNTVHLLIDLISYSIFKRTGDHLHLSLQAAHHSINLLILSLAVEDLLVGLIVIPVATVAIMESSWVFGKYSGEYFVYIGYVILS